MTRLVQNRLLIVTLGYSAFLLCHIQAADELLYDAVDYHCGDFINSTLNDEFMTFVYYFNNEFIRLLSNPFQHEKLFPGDNLSDLEAVKQSFTDRTNIVSFRV